jgi:hypothetical protein
LRPCRWKVEFEKKIRGALQQLKNESDKKIAQITDQMNEWKNKYNDLDLTTRQQISKLLSSHEGEQGCNVT